MKEVYPINWQGKHTHSLPVMHLAFSSTSKFFVTSCSNSTKLWRINGQIAGCSATISTADEPLLDENLPIACVNNEGTCVIVHKGMLVLTVYDVNLKDGVVSKREKIDIVREVRASGNVGFTTFISDRVTDLKFIEN